MYMYIKMYMYMYIVYVSVCTLYCVCFLLVQSVLGNISIHLNVDSLEGGMDGLMQVLTCNEVREQ